MDGVKLEDHEFVRFQSWLLQAAGINLSPAKKALVSGRLWKRLKHYGLTSYSQYFHMLMEDGGGGELQVALDLLTTNETYFFREPRHFDFMREAALPKGKLRRIFRVWSAACSTGEEVYTIAMILGLHFGQDPWEILGTDISQRVLKVAMSGHYPMERAKNIPQEYLKKYCLKGFGSQEGTFLINRELRSKVRFMQLNLNEVLPETGEFDMIFLRNVMIYFNLETKRKLVARLLPRLRPGGYFLVSHSESLNGICDSLRLVRPSIYQKPVP